ncbi:hypothetical protein K1T71_014177 [Dendrolimus kikuchii]|uniref:Uncharacterized protein n=1 Tax=Dendrolimus kikuchii TaxID=765133 RepID=A0ACC1CF87_9NEOP|nr:hypothetical protein K1T71_014177 [Dendrolimus kikuchii]
MAAKFVLAFCASALLAQVISAQCLGALNGLGGPGFIPDAFSLSGPAFGPGYGPACGSYSALTGIAPSNLGASCGGGLAVTSSSPISPTGLSVTSENAIEGALAVAGNLPFLGTVGVEGLYQTIGAGAVSYGCGNGAVGITSENVGPVAPAPLPQGIAPSPGVAPGLGYPPLNYMGRGGCGAIY